MTIRVEYMGFFKIEGIPSGTPVPVEPCTTIENLLDRMLVKKEARTYMVPLVNRTRKPFSHILQDDDSLFLYFPVGGG